jgi:hypothetical protein
VAPTEVAPTEVAPTVAATEVKLNEVLENQAPADSGEDRVAQADLDAVLVRAGSVIAVQAAVWDEAHPAWLVGLPGPSAI